MTLVLSLFPGIGLLDMAFEEEGFCVVRGPDLLWGGDIRCFHPPAGVFGGVIGGPPCQAFSRLRHLVHAQGREVAPDLIPEFVRCVAEAGPQWWVMENVPECPGIEVPGYQAFRQLVQDASVGGETRRLRTFWFGTQDGRPLPIEWLALHHPNPDPPVLASGGARPFGFKRTLRAIQTRKGASASGFKTEAYLRHAIRAQGLPDGFLAGAPMTVAGKIKAIGNGVPLAMGRAVAKAVAKVMCVPPQPAEERV